MKQLKCEMCGSTDLVKQDGMFVCQVCGTKYSVEEAKKMMIEGTVHVDSSHLVENYLSMAKNALEAGNNAEADNYCNKIIEVDPSSYEAWFIKGKAVGWQSTLGNQRISETINAFTHALENCPEEKKADLMEKCKQEIGDLHKALLTVRMQNFMNHPGEHDLTGLRNDVFTITSNSIGFLAKSGVKTSILGKEFGDIIMYEIVSKYDATIWKDYQGDDGRPGKYQHSRFVEESDICLRALKIAAALYAEDETNDLELYERRASIYDYMVKINGLIRNSCAWSYGDWGYYKSQAMTRDAVAQIDSEIQTWTAKANAFREKKIQRAKVIAQKRITEYWSNHKEEKEKLDRELSQLQEAKKQYADQIAALQKKKDDVPTFVQLNQIKSKIEKLQAEKKALGLFKTKEKKAVQEQIDAAEKEKEAVAKQVVVQQQEVEKEIEPIRAELKKVIAKIKEIENELTRDR